MNKPQPFSEATQEASFVVVDPSAILKRGNAEFLTEQKQMPSTPGTHAGAEAAKDCPAY